MSETKMFLGAAAAVFLIVGLVAVASGPEWETRDPNPIMAAGPWVSLCAMHSAVAEPGTTEVIVPLGEARLVCGEEILYQVRKGE